MPGLVPSKYIISKICFKHSNLWPPCPGLPVHIICSLNSFSLPWGHSIHWPLFISLFITFVLDLLARLDWWLWQKLLIPYPIFIRHLHYYKLWFCSGWHHAKRNKCPHFWAFFAVKFDYVSQFCPVDSEWQSPGLGSRGCFAFLMRGYSNNWRVPSPLPLFLSPEHSHDIWSFSKHLATMRWQAQEQKATLWRWLGHKGGKGLGPKGFPELRIFS